MIAASRRKPIGIDAHHGMLSLSILQGRASLDSAAKPSGGSSPPDGEAKMGHAPFGAWREATV